MLVAGEDEQVAEVGGLIELVHDLRVIPAGPLGTAAALEAMTAVLLTVNASTCTRQTSSCCPPRRDVQMSLTAFET